MRNPNCTLCGLCKGVNTVCLWGKGPTPCDIMILGRDPGEKEDIKGELFVGRSGKLLNEFLQAAGLKRENVYITNVVKCHPFKNRPHTPDERKACRVYLDQEIAAVKPKVIITLGGDALEAITGQNQMMKFAGKVIDYKNENTGFSCKVFAAVHPSYILRNINYKEKTLKHFETFGKILRGETPKRSAVKYINIQNINQFRRFMKKMHEQKVIVFDTETTGFDFLNDRILCYSFSWKENTGVVLPLLGYKEEAIWTEEELSEIHTELKNIYADPTITWVAQNISFDMKFLKTAGIEIVGPIEDTMLLQTLCDENAKDLKGLKAMAEFYTDMGNYDEPLEEYKTQLKIKKRKELQGKQKVVRDRIKDLKKMLKKADEATTTKINQDIAAGEKELNELSKVSTDITYAEIPTNILWYYAAMDADATMRVFHIFKKKLQSESNTYAFSHNGRPTTSLVRYYHKLIMKLRRVLDDMEYRGAKVDIAYLHELDKKYTKKISELEQTLLNMPEVVKVSKILLLKSQKKAEERYKTLKSVIDYKAGITTKKPKFTQKEYGIHHGKPVPFNMNSHVHLRILLFDVLKLVHPFLEKKGKTGLSVDKEILEALEDKHKCVAILQENRKLTKLHKTYVLGQIKRADANDRIHTNFNQHITVTGRLSSSDPNLQNIPRANKEIKKAFITSHKDWYMVQMDYGQAEFRMWAELSNDQDMINDIRCGLDIHRATAAQFWGIPAKDVTKAQRSAAKFVVFGLMYGRGAESVAKQVKITVDEAKAIIAQFFAKYPVASRWLNVTKKFVEMRGFSPGYFGRVRRLPYACNRYADKKKWSESMRQAVNSPIQGGAADLTGIAMIKISKALKAHPEWKAHLILTVHDSIILEVHKDSLVDVVKMCHQKMTEKVDNMQVPMAADIEIGPNWGDLTEISVTNIDEDVKKFLEKEYTLVK